MASVQLYARQQNTGQFVALDLNEAEPIKLNLSVANIIDPTATNSVFSKTFRVPHTSINGPYFEGVFNVNSMDFDAAAKADAYILDNGIFFENGNIRLNAIYTNAEDNSVEYEITFYGSTSDFGSKIGGGFLNEVNLNAFNHTKNYENITASWTGGLFNYDVVYGLIEWGYTYDNNNRPDIPTLSAGFEKSFTNQGATGYPKSPYKLQQWKPQIRAKALWDQIFEEAGYTYDSVFLESDFFKKQYIISDNEARATLDNANTFRAEKQGLTYNVIGAQFPWVTPIEIEDPGSNFVASDNASGIYTAPSTGNYQFEMDADQVEVYIYGQPGQDDAIVGWEAKVVDVDTGQVVGLDVSSWTFDPNNPFTQTLNATIYTNLTANQRVKFEFRTFRISGPIVTGGTQIQFYGTSVSCTDAPNIMSFNAIMPSNIRKIDFMKSIINRYRLVFVPSKFEANHFTITPWKDWILEGRSKDWTNKLDISKDMVIKPLFFDQARFQIYKDQEDSDYLNYNYQLGIKQTFGQLNLDSTNELIKGTKEYKDQFSPTPLDGIGYKGGAAGSETTAAAFLIPHMAKDTGGNGASEGTGATAVSVGKREPIQPKLRLVFYNGMKTAPISWFMATNPEADPVFASERFSYPMMSQYSEWPVTSSTFDLNWENEEPLYNIEKVTEYFNTNSLTNPKAQTGFSCFNTFWKTWYDVTFDPYSRIVEANFVLDYNDILDLKFNDYIFVKDAWYFVNSITDYVTGTVSNCKVQLVKLGNNVGITLPVVSPPTYVAQETCYHPTVKCTAACCATYDGSETATIYTDNADLETSTVAYQDAFGGILAAPGYYKNSTGTIYVNGNGAIVVQTTNDCNCVPVYYSFTANFNSSGCTVCCEGGPTAILYGANSTFEFNSHFYQDQLLTIPVPAGFYKQAGATFALQVAPNGSVVNNFLCNTCNCTVYYPFTVCKAAALCDSCCCPRGTSTIYGTSANFANNTKLYLDNAGISPAPAAWYKYDSTTVAQVTGIAGDITAFGTCSGCPTCPVGPVDITVNVSAQIAGYTTSTILQKSYDNGSTWIDVGVVTVEASDPANTQKSQIFNTELDVRVRTINSTNTVGGFMQTYYAIGIDQFENTTIATPANRTVTISSMVTDEVTYEFNNIVTGGTVIDEDLFVASGYFSEYKNAGWPSSGGSSIGSILGLDKDANVNTAFDVNNGLFATTRSTSVFKSVTDGNSIFVSISNSFGSNFRLYYKNTALTDGVVKLNLNGDLDTTFSSNFTKGISSSATGVFIANNKLFSTNAFSPRILCTDFNGVTDNTFTSPTTGSTNDRINKIIFYNNFYYVVGSFTTVNGSTYNRLVVLNTDGTINTTESAKFATAFNGEVNDAVLYNNALILVGSFTTYKGASSSAVAVLDITTGNVLSGFNIGTGLTFAIPRSVTADASGIYIGITQTTTTAPRYKFAFINSVFKIDYTGTFIPEFNTGAFLDDNLTYVDVLINNLSFDGSDLLISGLFKTVNNVVSSGLIKVNATNGSRISTFDVGAGFQKADINGSSNSTASALIIGSNVYVTGFFQAYKGAENNCVIKLNSTATKQTDFDTGNGFRVGDLNGTFGIIKIPNIASDNNDNIYAIADFTSNITCIRPLKYKGNKTDKTVIKLSSSGAFDSTFNANFPETDLSWIDVVGDKLYTDGRNGSIPQDAYIRRYNLDGTVDSNWNLVTPDSGMVPTVNSVVLHNNLLYFAGYWKNSPDPTPTGAYTPVWVMNLDGTYNATETNKFVKFSGGSLTTGTGTGIAIYNNILYLVGTFRPNYDGVACGNIIAADLATGNRVTAFNQGTGFPAATSGIIADSTGLYVSGVTTYNGSAVNAIIKLDFNGAIISAFNTGTISSGVSGIRLAGDKIYAYGQFTTVNGQTSRGLVALNKTDGTINATFNVGSGFTPITGSNFGLVLDIIVKEGVGLTTYPINVSYSAESPCASYCATPYSTVIYGNGLSLVQSTALYSNQSGSTFAAAGWYSDGTSIAQVDSNGVIIGYTNINTCNCNTLYSFEVTFDAETCIACGTTGTPANTTVWGTQQNWSSNQVLYTNAQGTTFALPGWYAYVSSIALNVGTNGYVQNSVDCSVACGTSGNCVGYSITNGSGNVISYSYITCFDQSIVFGEIYPGDPTFYTGCAVEGSVAAPGANIQQVAVC